MVWNREEASAQTEEQSVPVSRQFWQIAAETVTFLKSAHKSAVSCLLNKKCKRSETIGLQHFGPNDQLQGLAWTRVFLFTLPRSKGGCNYVSESTKVLSQQHTPRSRTRDGVFTEIQCLSLSWCRTWLQNTCRLVILKFWKSHSRFQDLVWKLRILSL